MKCKYDHIKFTEKNTHDYKTCNEDAMLLSKGTFPDGTQVLFALVSDGMGGQSFGNLASSITKETLRDWFISECKSCLKATFIEDAIAKSWDSAISIANNKVNSIEAEKKPGCTLSMLLIYQGHFYAANIGDSRIYRFTGSKLYQVTRDHSWAQSELEKGTPPQLIESDVRKNKITRCIGCGVSEVEPDYYEGECINGDIFIVCSDGLRHRISASEIEDALRKCSSLANTIITLKDIARSRGEADDITAILIKLEMENGILDTDAKTVML